MADDTYERVRKHVVDTFGDDRVEPQTRFEDLGADSLDLLELTMEFEAEFDIEIPDDDLLGVETVQDAVDKVDAALARP